MRKGRKSLTIIIHYDFFAVMLAQSCPDIPEDVTGINTACGVLLCKLW